MHNFHGYNNARKRRHERRKELQEAHNINTQLQKAFSNIDSIKSEIAVKPARPILSLNRKAMDRVEKAISIKNTPMHDNLSNCCLPNTAIYSTKTKFRRSSKAGEITARA
ncbi:hypothetical protein [Xenorhabdus griffiniae]|uniref:Transcriptional regulator n=1 Tax=Xenorhabdus griffiniae TaxID=351672 RepID=A0ABY9XFI4_9GAMM|nr:hypothetical protein [Xenorhabdus griffiniae]MBD1227700.1 hypothetical protein [Xenorhabdus griffiniae]MBE8587021.1 hypothetical protein [Xenorhabdus griffiniae]WMV71685.1 hypothetical protein QL128_16320 [Xenorhabdus griffiniae]WNH01362.1 hypothetical protein QL112_016325 [Xenorhabdus griffiniae]